MKKASLWGLIFISVLLLATILASCSLFVASAPIKLSANALSQSTVKLTWNSVAKNFVIYRSSSSASNFTEISTSQATQYVDTGLTPSTTYYYQVKAKNQYGLSAPSNVASATTFEATPQPPVLSVTAFSTNTLTLSWSENSSNVNQFNLYRSKLNSAFAQIASLLPNQMNFTDKNLTPETTYAYKMIAVNAGGSSAYSNVVVQMTNGLPPKAPQSLKVTGYSTSTISLSWNNLSKSLKGFEIYESTPQSTASTVTKIEMSATSYVATGLKPNTYYTYKVRAFNNWGYSDFSNIVSQMTRAFGSYFPIQNGKVDRAEVFLGAPMIDQLGENPAQKAFEDFFSSKWMDLSGLFSNVSKINISKPSSMTVKEDIIYEATSTGPNATMINYNIKIPMAYVGQPRKMETLSFKVSKESSLVIFEGVPLIDNATTGNSSGTTLFASSKGVFTRTSSYFATMSIGNNVYSDVLKVGLILNNLKQEFYFARNTGIIKLNDYLFNQNKIWEFISGMTVVNPDIGKFEYNPEPAILIAPKLTDLSTSTLITMSWASTAVNVKYDLYLEKMGEWVKKIGSSTQTYFDFQKLPNGLYTWIVVTQNASGLSTASKVATFTVNMGQRIEFADHNLEALIRSALKLPAGPIYTSELSKIKSISNNWPSPENAISNLEGLQYCTNLATLDLIGNNVTDISVLKYLKNLKKLNLSHNNIIDISPLASLTNLESLDLSYNKIADISALSTLVNLKILKLGSNQIVDISAISNLKNLQVLDLSSNKINNVLPLKDIGQSMLNLDISYNPIPVSQLDFIKSWTQLHNLGISGFDLNNSQITFLSKFTDLTSLDLGFNRISNLTPLASLTSLQKLFLYSNMISDLSPLSNLSNLEWLNAGNNLISNVGPLSNLNKLTFLDLNMNKISDISPLLGLSNLQILNLSFNKITLSYTPTFTKMLHLVWLLLDSNSLTSINILSTAPDIWLLDLSSNNISDISPLSNMKNLLRVDLDSNIISNIDAIVSTFHSGSIVNLIKNNLDLQSYNTVKDLSTMKNNGVLVMTQVQ